MHELPKSFDINNHNPMQNCQFANPYGFDLDNSNQN